MNLVGIAYGIDPKLIPHITETGKLLGYITHECALETGFPEGLPYITTGNDKSCEALGCGSIDSTTAHISYGTASSISVVSKRYFSPEMFCLVMLRVLTNIIQVKSKFIVVIGC